MAKWRKPTFEEEAAAIERASQDLSIPLDELRRAMATGKLEDLDGYTWCTLQNTDCNDTFSLAEAERVAARHGQDIGPISRAIARREQLPAPIILEREDQRPYLVAGNVRLMVCRGLDVRPKVWRIRVSGV